MRLDIVKMHEKKLDLVLFIAQNYQSHRHWHGNPSLRNYSCGGRSFKKSWFMIVCKNLVNVDNFKLTIQYNNSIENTKSIKYLGVDVGNILAWKIHINYLQKKTFKSMWRNL